VAGVLRNTSLVLAGLLLLALPAAGQLTLGELSSNLNGSVSAGYTGDYGNQIESNHGLAFGGSGTLSGFYYNPNFISFTVSPYMNQARDNSSFQSISNASGVNLDASIFGGSRFPGAINYSKAYNSEGNFAIPGMANYTTHGDSDTFGINWSELVPGLPSLSANFQMGSGQYSIYGSNDSGSTDSRALTLRSGYTLKGFNMSAFFSDGRSTSDIPQVLENSTSETATSSSHTYGFTVSHALPFHGGFAASATSSDFNSDFLGNNNHGNVDTYTAAGVFQPTQKFNFSVSTNYSTNLSGTLYEAIAGTGGVAPPLNLGETSHSLDLSASAGYAVMDHMQAQAFADHREQTFLGESFGANSFGGGVIYGRPWLGGNINAALSLSDNTISTSSQNSLGFNGSVNYNRRFEAWVTSVSFNYSQNVQTLLVTYMSSSYGYGASVRRRWGKFGWSAGGGGSKTLLTEQAGTSSSSESLSTSINYSHWLTANGNYSKSNGNAIETGVGLTQTPIPQPIVPLNDLILYGGKSYSFGLSSSPTRRLTFAGSFAKSISNTNLEGTLSSNNSKMINALFQYQFRKVYLTGGYSNLVQGFSASGLPPENVSSFYIGVTRWFNFF